MWPIDCLIWFEANNLSISTMYHLLVALLYACDFEIDYVSMVFWAEQILIVYIFLVSHSVFNPASELDWFDFMPYKTH